MALMAYATKSDVKTYLDITGTADDSLMDDLLDAATAMIDNYTGRVFAVSADTERTFDAIGKDVSARTLFLDRDLCSVTTVTNGDGVEVASDEYRLVPKEAPYWAIEILSTVNKSWGYSATGAWEDAIVVEGKWGYSVTPPDDIKQACARLAAFLYRQRDAQMMDVTAIEAGVVLKPQGMPADVRVMLHPYRRIV